MSLTNEKKAGPKVLSFALFIVGLLTLAGGWYTLGIWLPVFSFSVFFAVCKGNSIIGLVPIKYFQALFYLFLGGGFIIYIMVNANYAASWFIAAFVFSFSFKIVRYLLTGFGLLSSLFNI